MKRHLKKARERLSKGLFKLAGWASKTAFDLADAPLTPKADRIKYPDEDDEDVDEPLGVGATTELYNPHTSESLAMIAKKSFPKVEPKKEPLAGSIESRMPDKL